MESPFIIYVVAIII